MIPETNAPYKFVPGLRAAVLFRISDKRVKNNQRATEELKRIESQNNAVMKKIVDEGLILDPKHIYKEAHTARVSREHRPDFIPIFEAAKNREFDILLVWKMDRFCRSGTQDGLNYLNELYNNNISLYCIEGNWADMRTHESRLIVEIQLFMAATESDSTSKRVKQQRQTEREIAIKEKRAPKLGGVKAVELTPDQIAKVKEKATGGWSVAAILEEIRKDNPNVNTWVIRKVLGRV
jgi:DNA invertase Pin-like site-specific DNA recombinase